jgi:hypothetical protein
MIDSKEIKKLREALTELTDNIKEHSDRLTDWDRIPVLEMNVVIGKISKLYEKAIVLREMIERSENAGVPQKDTSKSKVIIEKIQESKDEELALPPAVEEAKKSVLTEEEQKDVEDDNSLAAKLKYRPISDLTKSLGINEKYLFSNELFNGNSSEMAETLKTLNNFNSFSDAQQKLNDLSKKYNWDKKNSFYKEFELLVKRRFS